jgi:TRAP-type C4-dicarboxylate transport system substrate-binding protein
MKQKLFGGLLAVCLVLAIGSPVFGKVELDLSLGHVWAPGSGQALALDKYAELVGKNSSGRIKVNVFHAAQLGSNKVQVEAVKMGSQDMMMESFVFFAPYAKAFRITEVPFAWKNREHILAWVASDSFKKAQDEVIKNGNQRFINMNLLWHRGPFRYLLAKRPVMSVDDLKGLKMRLWEEETIHAAWRGYGVSTVGMPWGDVYLGLRQGTIDSVTGPWDLLWASKHTEVAKYITLLKQFWQISCLSMNEKKWQSTSKEFQGILTKSADEAGQYYNKLTEDLVEETKRNVLDKHNAVIIEVNRQPFIDKMQKEILPKMEASGLFPPGIVDEVKKLAPKE